MFNLNAGPGLFRTGNLVHCLFFTVIYREDAVEVGGAKNRPDSGMHMQQREIPAGKDTPFEEFDEEGDAGRVEKGHVFETD